MRSIDRIQNMTAFKQYVYTIVSRIADYLRFNYLNGSLVCLLVCLS